MSDRVDALVIFGATGDLAKIETFPALVGLVERDVLNVPVIGVSKKGWDLEQFRDYATASLQLNNMDPASPAAVKMLGLLRYVDGDLGEDATYRAMSDVIGAGGLGAAAGPLIGGVVTSAISWRASFGLQVLVVGWIILLARKIIDTAPAEPRPSFDVIGAVLSAAGLFFIVLGLLQSRTYGFGKSRQDFTIGNTVVIPKGSLSPVWILVAIGALFLLWFFLYTRSAEKKHKDVLLPLRLFRNKVSNLGLGTQTIQWLILQGTFFVVSVYLQQVDHYDAIKTGLILTPGTIGILAASAAADRFARRHPQRWLIVAGFLITAIGMILLLTLVRAHAGYWRWIPGLFLFGVGVGTMLTSSVNVVQSSFPEADQGEISGLSRSVSNLGSSFGTALVGSALVAVKLPEGKPFAVALIMMIVFTVIGLVLGFLIPRGPIDATAAPSPSTKAGVQA